MSESALTPVALLGTSRGRKFPPCPHESLEGPWQQLDSSQILPAAALEAAAIATGRILEKGTPLRLADPDPRAPIPPAAADKLSLILAGNTPECLHEFLQHAVHKNFRAPHSHIPDLLGYGQGHPQFHYQISRLVGPRGHWLSNIHQSWNWLGSSDPIDDEAWETGSPSERLQWLRKHRLDDLSTAHSAISATWKSEDPAFRVDIIKLAHVNLQESDESWLTPALSDGRREVRDAATAALLKINSAFRTRSRHRATPLLSLKGKQLSVTPPADFDDTWKSDGLRQKPPAKTGERAWWLRQILARIPLPDWPQLLGLPSEKIFSLKIDSDWSNAVHLAWIDSAKFHPAPDFVPELIKLSPQSVNELIAPLHFYAMCDVIEKLPLNLAIPQLVRLSASPPAGNSFQKQILTALLKDKVQTRPEARALAMCLDSSEIEPTLETIAKQKSINSMTEEFARTLEFRQSYLKPLTI